MRTDPELNYRLFLQIEEDFKRTEIKSEFARYDAVKNGDVEQVRADTAYIAEHYYEGKGKLSDDLLRNNQYHFAIGTGIIARICIDGGMNHNIAYTLSDIYIKKCDRCIHPDDIVELTIAMMLDFAQRMREVRKENSVSLHIRRTVDFIYSNLGEPLTLKMAAEHEGLDPSYLSKLFSKEMKIPLKAFIQKARVSTAKNILAYSDFPISEISASLGFSSQSAFTAVFRKLTGMTPMQYRRSCSDGHSFDRLTSEDE